MERTLYIIELTDYKDEQYRTHLGHNLLSTDALCYCFLFFNDSFVFCIFFSEDKIN